jgi:hypothetical protein
MKVTLDLDSPTHTASLIARALEESDRELWLDIGWRLIYDKENVAAKLREWANKIDHTIS